MSLKWGRNYSRYVHKHFESFFFIQTPLRPLTNFYKVQATFPERSHTRIDHCLSIQNHPGTETPFKIPSRLILNWVRKLTKIQGLLAQACLVLLVYPD